MADWSITGFQNLLAPTPAASATGGTVTTRIDLSDLTRFSQGAQVFGCNCGPTSDRSGLSQAEKEAAWRENGA